MIKTLIESLREVGHDTKTVFIVADDKELFDALDEIYPSKTFNIGIAECGAISVAAGMASCGRRPYVIGGATFMAHRAFDFIRVQLCIQPLDVKVIAIGAGLAINTNGNTHNATEDVSALRALPNLRLLTPATATETGYVLKHADAASGPCYIRIGRSTGEDFLSSGKVSWQFGKVSVVKQGEKMMIISSGSICSDALAAANRFDEGQVGVVDIHSVRPLDEDGLIKLAARCSNWLVVEEHNIRGGLFGAIAEVIVKHNLNVRATNIGLDGFAIGYGNYDQIKEKNGLGIADICARCDSFLKEIEQ